MKYRLHVLPLADLRELRLGESSIHQHQPGTELAARGHGDDEAAVVAAEQPHDRARGDAESRSARAPTPWTGRRPACRSRSRARRRPPAMTDTCGRPGSPSSPAVRRRARSSRSPASRADCRGRGCRCHAAASRPFAISATWLTLGESWSVRQTSRPPPRRRRCSVAPDCGETGVAASADQVELTPGIRPSRNASTKCRWSSRTVAA